MPSNTYCSELKKVDSHLSYRVVEYEGIRELFLSAVPKENLVCQNDFQGHGKIVPDVVAQMRSVLEDIEAVLKKEGFIEPVIIQTVFLSDIGNKQLLRYEIAQFHKDQVAVTTYVPQTPCEGGELAIELHAIQNGVSAKQYSDQAVGIRYKDLEWLFVSDITSNPERIPNFSLNACPAGWSFAPKMVDTPSSPLCIPSVLSERF